MIQLTYPWIGSRTNFKFEKYGGLCCCVLSFFDLNLYLIATNFGIWVIGGWVLIERAWKEGRRGKKKEWKIVQIHSLKKQLLHFCYHYRFLFNNAFISKIQCVLEKWVDILVTLSTCIWIWIGGIITF